MTQAVLWLPLSSALVIIISHIVVLPPGAAATVSSNVTSPLPAARRPDCPKKCGDVDIPYPFGIGDGCFAPWPEYNFSITCNDSFSPPKPLFGDFEILNISVETGEMRVVGSVSYICYDSYNTTESDGAAWSFKLPSWLLISETRNTFTAIGCSTTAFLVGRDDMSFFTGCISTCDSVEQAAKDDVKCAGLGCCQIGIPGNLSTIGVDWGNLTGTVNPAWKYSPCSYAFVAEENWYHFRRDHLTWEGSNSFTSRVNKTIPMVLDWAITSNKSCQITSKASGTPAIQTTSACARNSKCVKATQGNGRYRCKCSPGYQGNPYDVNNGCTDINECDLQKLDPKKYYCGSRSECRNTPGGYDCICKGFYSRGNGKSKKGCQFIIPIYAVAIVATLVAIVLLAVLLWFLLRKHKRRVRQGFFDKNGGKLLKGMGINIYTEEDLEKMTDGYSRPIGQGNFGKVFMGTIENNQRVAVKCAKNKDSRKAPEGGQFESEIQFQFHMRHDNLVRLVGCCLETDVPMLVFEFVPNGSLSDVLHGAGNRRALSLLERLDIAIGSAKALAHMHYSSGDLKRIHGDVKPGNILLDDNLLPKVSDFGSSKVMPTSSRYVRFVATDRNYLDPVYYKTGRFSEKSDVYSFGVVLLEIITRKPANYDVNRSLPLDFVKSCKVDGNGRKMYDRDILTSDDAKSHAYMECLDRIAELAVRCLKDDDDERPNMVEVVKELEEVKERASG